jgi:hypothetical protein
VACAIDLQILPYWRLPVAYVVVANANRSNGNCSCCA